MADIVRRNPEWERGLSRLDPFRMMEALTNFDLFRPLERALGPMLETKVTFAPTVDVKETKDSYVFKADVPGLKDEDLDISVSGNQLMLSGKREAEERKEEDRYYSYERSYGSFSRSFTLPEGTDLEHVNAELKDGVLTVVVPKTEVAQPKHISIKAGKEKPAGKVQA
ncbi:MAG: Hsp20/alpha crystallin family protein [Myxococcaceae bacterium]